jgi:hypothetical protein
MLVVLPEPAGPMTPKISSVFGFEAVTHTQSSQPVLATSTLIEVTVLTPSLAMPLLLGGAEVSTKNALRPGALSGMLS